MVILSLFKANTVNGGYFEQKYELSPTDYTLGYTIKTKDLGSVLTSGTNSIPLQWENHLGKYEKGVQFEQNYSPLSTSKKKKNPLIIVVVFLMIPKASKIKTWSGFRTLINFSIRR